METSSNLNKLLLSRIVKLTPNTPCIILVCLLLILRRFLNSIIVYKGLFVVEQGRSSWTLVVILALQVPHCELRLSIHQLSRNSVIDFAGIDERLS